MRELTDDEVAALAARERENELATEREEAARRNRYRRRLSVIPKRYRRFTLSDCVLFETEDGKQGVLEPASAFAKAGELVSRGGLRSGLIVAGGFGTGKTVLATAVLKELMWRRDAAGLWVKWHTLISEVQSTYSPGATDTRAGVIAKYQRADVLLIDDVGDLEKAYRATTTRTGRGTERGQDPMTTDDRRRILYEILDHRNDWMRPTLMTTNLASETQLSGHFGERTFQRMLEMCALLTMQGTNYRVHPPRTNPPTTR